MDNQNTIIAYQEKYNVSCKYSGGENTVALKYQYIIQSLLLSPNFAQSATIAQVLTDMTWSTNDCSLWMDKAVVST